MLIIISNQFILLQQYFRTIEKINYNSSVNFLKPMGSNLSQSQQLRSTFPLSEYKILPPDNNFPSLTLVQRLSDAANFAVSVTDKTKQNYDVPSSKHVIKRVDKKQIGKKLYQVYEWANASVHGLTEYISIIDRNRSISKSQFNAILEGAVRGYSALNKQSSEIECLQISMKSLRIFNEISLKLRKSNSKEVINQIIVKVNPKNITDFANQSGKQSSCWNHIGSCIHQGGILTEKQLLGEYLLRLSDIATKANFKNKNESLKNLRLIYGSKAYQVIQSLLSNQDWKFLLKILDKSQEMQNQSSKQNKISLKKDCTTFEERKGREMIKTQKTIDTQKNKSSKELFQRFKSEQKGINRNINLQKRSNMQMLNQKVSNTEIFSQKNINHPVQEQARQRIYQNQNIRPLTHVKSEKYFSPPSTRIIREVTPPKVIRNRDESNNIDNFKQTQNNSILTIFPDVFREQPNHAYRILPARMMHQQMGSHEGQKISSYFVSSPRIKNSPQLHSPRDEKQNEQKEQKLIANVTKRIGKPIEFQPSKINPTLKSFSFPENTLKIKPDIIENKSINLHTSIDLNTITNFLSQDFKELNFELAEKFYNSPLQHVQLSPRHKV